MGKGMVREVDRAIGAISTLVLGVGFLMIREFLRSSRGNKRPKGEELDEDEYDMYYRRKYGYKKKPLFQHFGSCDCQDLKFFVLAPKALEAFDDSNVLSCKKGRYPYLIVPVTCFEILETNSEMAIYEPHNTTTQHLFCGKCGVHIFHFDRIRPDHLAINVYCLEEENIEDLKIIFMPKGAQPVYSGERSLYNPLHGTSSTINTTRHQQSRAFRSDITETKTAADATTTTTSLQNQMLLWSRLEDRSTKVCEGVGPEDTQSTTSTSSRSRRFSFTSEDQNDVISMKEQVEYYLKRHLDDPRVLSDNQYDV